MFSDEVHCIGLYTPFEPESNPPPREDEIFQGHIRDNHRSGSIKKRAPSHLAVLARTRSPQSTNSNLYSCSLLEQNWLLQPSTLTATST